MQDAAVGDAVLDEADHPCLVEVIEGSYDTLPIIRTLPSESRSSALVIRLRLSVRSFPWRRVEVRPDDCVMVQSEGSGAERRVRRWRSVAEKLRILELTFEPQMSVALVARAHGVNANQVFKWRQAF